MDIFAELEQEAEKEEQRAKQDIDLGIITPLVRKQAALEKKAEDHKVARLYDYAKRFDCSIEDIEGALKKRKKDLFQIKQIQIPEIMGGFNLDAVTTTDGTKIEIKDGISVSVRDVDKLHAYLRKDNAGDLIKNQVIVEAYNDETRKKLINQLVQYECSFKTKEAVHPSTLKKHIGDGLKVGKKPDDDIVNIHEYRYSKIK